MGLFSWPRTLCENWENLKRQKKSNPFFFHFFRPSSSISSIWKWNQKEFGRYWTDFKISQKWVFSPDPGPYVKTEKIWKDKKNRTHFFFTFFALVHLSHLSGSEIKKNLDVIGPFLKFLKNRSFLLTPDLRWKLRQKNRTHFFFTFFALVHLCQVSGSEIKKNLDVIGLILKFLKNGSFLLTPDLMWKLRQKNRTHFFFTFFALVHLSQVSGSEIKKNLDVIGPILKFLKNGSFLLTPDLMWKLRKSEKTKKIEPIFFSLFSP